LKGPATGKNYFWILLFGKTIHILLFALNDNALELVWLSAKSQSKHLPEI